MEKLIRRLMDHQYLTRAQINGFDNYKVGLKAGNKDYRGRLYLPSRGGDLPNSQKEKPVLCAPYLFSIKILFIES